MAKSNKLQMAGKRSPTFFALPVIVLLPNKFLIEFQRLKMMAEAKF